MDFVVLAAGDGTRMPKKAPKPLVELSGQPILKHVLDRLAQASPGRLILVTGRRHREIEAFLRQHRAAYPFEIITVINRDVERENGYSLLQVQPFVQDRFLLTMADHLVDPKLYFEARDHHGLGLCVDRAPTLTPAQVDDATKVWIEANQIKEIGKALERWNGIDTGVFSMTPRVFEALNGLRHCHRITVTDAVSVLIREGEPFGAIDVSGAFWRDIDTLQDLELTEEGPP